jgi:hypothetical protein
MVFDSVLLDRAKRCLYGLLGLDFLTAAGVRPLPVAEAVKRKVADGWARPSCGIGSTTSLACRFMGRSRSGWIGKSGAL